MNTRPDSLSRPYDAYSISAAISSDAIGSARENPVVRITIAATAVAMKPARSVTMWR